MRMIEWLNEQQQQLQGKIQNLMLCSLKRESKRES